MLCLVVDSGWVGRLSYLDFISSEHTTTNQCHHHHHHHSHHHHHHRHYNHHQSHRPRMCFFLLQLARAAIFLAGYRGSVYGYHVCSAVSLLGTQRVVKLEEGLEGCCESGLGRVSRVCCYSDKGRGCVGVSMRRGNGRGVQSCTEIQSFG